MSMFLRILPLLFLPCLCSSDKTINNHACTQNTQCLNNGSCYKGNQSVNGIHDNYCSCVHPWSGQYCEQKCTLDCQNNGICGLSLTTDPNASPYSCRCRGRFDGNLCQTPFVLCPDRSKCFNGGTCILADPSTNTYACTCPTNRSGYACDRVSRTSSGVLGGVEKDTGLSTPEIVGVVVASVVIVVGSYMGISYLNRLRGYRQSADTMRRQTNAAFEMDDLSLGREHENEREGII